MDELPQGLLQAMAHDIEKTARFAGLDEAQKREVVARARLAKSREEIENIVNRL